MNQLEHHIKALQSYGFPSVPMGIPYPEKVRHLSLFLSDLHPQIYLRAPMVAEFLQSDSALYFPWPDLVEMANVLVLENQNPRSIVERLQAESNRTEDIDKANELQAKAVLYAHMASKIRAKRALSNKHKRRRR